MTFSIAGRCARTGMLGAVVTTSAMAVGSRCAWAEAGVGAALTQHRTDPRLGPIMLGQLRSGRAPEAIVRELEKSDPNLKWRQLALIAQDGRGAFFNGQKITSIAKGRVGRDCVAVGNIIRSGLVPFNLEQSVQGAGATLPDGGDGRWGPHRVTLGRLQFSRGEARWGATLEASSPRATHLGLGPPFAMYDHVLTPTLPS